MIDTLTETENELKDRIVIMVVMVGRAVALSPMRTKQIGERP